jgi:hypothetical protein
MCKKFANKTIKRNTNKKARLKYFLYLLIIPSVLNIRNERQKVNILSTFPNVQIEGISIHLGG